MSEENFIGGTNGNGFEKSRYVGVKISDITDKIWERNELKEDNMSKENGNGKKMEWVSIDELKCQPPTQYYELAELRKHFINQCKWIFTKHLQEQLSANRSPESTRIIVDALIVLEGDIRKDLKLLESGVDINEIIPDFEKKYGNED